MKVTALVTEIKPVQEIPSKTVGRPPTPKLVFTCDNGKEYNIFGKAELQKAVKVGENISMEVEEKEWAEGRFDRKVVSIDGVAQTPKFGGGFKESPEKQHSIEEMKRADIINQQYMAGKITSEDELYKRLRAWLMKFRMNDTPASK